MFPQDFEHEGEHLVEPMPSSTWYERVSQRRVSHVGGSGVVPFRESWQRQHGPGGKYAFWNQRLAFDVGKAKTILTQRPRLPSFVEVDVFEGGHDVEPYLEIIYKEREDEWPWVRLHVPGIVGFHEGVPLLIDGNHRYAKARRLKVSHFLAFMLTDEEMDEVRTMNPAVSAYGFDPSAGTDVPAGDDASDWLKW